MIKQSSSKEERRVLTMCPFVVGGGGAAMVTSNVDEEGSVKDTRKGRQWKFKYEYLLHISWGRELFLGYRSTMLGHRSGCRSDTVPDGLARRGRCEKVETCMQEAGEGKARGDTTAR
jgi:hypothetical protein